MGVGGKRTHSLGDYALRSWVGSHDYKYPVQSLPWCLFHRAEREREESPALLFSDLLLRRPPSIMKVEGCPGLKATRNPFWSCCLTFLCRGNKAFHHIMKPKASDADLVERGGMVCICFKVQMVIQIWPHCDLKGLQMGTEGVTRYIFKIRLLSLELPINREKELPSADPQLSQLQELDRSWPLFYNELCYTATQWISQRLHKNNENESKHCLSVKKIFLVTQTLSKTCRNPIHKQLPFSCNPDCPTVLKWLLKFNSSWTFFMLDPQAFF